ncbi:hypothetical protein E1200_01195 [Actinomadura sp. GC306]|uniref:hypothetical protein n=1 Tax=Actinomadura sp. GC306 TaxID=2530367 RepID=UPI0010489701|nr:hypothetical protein [Actinomadura sp. GC306]TDC71684.1 hypothetical protein E1200_01195 [Actinomadura sp. GC306]
MDSQSPDRILDEVARLRRLTRARARGAAVPLAIFGLLTLASIALYSHPFQAMQTLPDGGAASRPGSTSGYAGLDGFDRSASLSIAFWLVTGPLSYLACAWWYRRRAARVGLTVRWQPWAYTGAALFAVFLFAVFAQDHGGQGAPPPLGGEFAASAVVSPLLAIAVGLLVLAKVERSPGVAVCGLLYGGLCVIMNGYGLGQVPPWIAPPSGGTIDGLVNPAQNLFLLAAVLLVGALLVQLRAWARLRSVTAAAPVQV